MRRRHFLVVAGLAASVGSLVFACGSSDGGAPDAGGGPAACEGAACTDGGGSESSKPDGSSTDGPIGDAPRDAPGSDGGACRLGEGGAEDGGALQWGSNFGATGHSTPTATALDPSTDDVVVTGSFFGSIDFGGGLLMSQAPGDGSGSDVFVTKLDKNGAYQWGKTFGDGKIASATTVTVKATSHHVVVGGGFFSGSTLDFGCGPLTATGDVDLFLVDFDALGNCVWSKKFGVAGEVQNLLSIAADPAGNVVVGGIARGGVTFGGVGLTGYFVAKFTAAGVHTWSKAVAASSTTSSPTHAVDPEGNVFLAGSFVGSADFGGGIITTAGGRTEAFLAKYDASGAYKWVKHYAAVPTVGTSNAGSAVSNGALGIDGCGNAFIAGGFGAQTGGASIDFGGGPLAAPGNPNETYRFLAKIDGEGKAMWSRMFVGTSVNHIADLYLGALRVDGRGGPVLTAQLAGDESFAEQTSVNFGGGSLTNTSKGSVAIASFDALGNHRWSYVGGSPSTARSTTGGIDANGRVIALAAPFSRCTGTCSTSPAGATLALAGRTFTAVSGQDIALTTFTQ